MLYWFMFWNLTWYDSVFCFFQVSDSIPFNFWRIFCHLAQLCTISIVACRRFTGVRPCAATARSSFLQGVARHFETDIHSDITYLLLCKLCFFLSGCFLWLLSTLFFWRLQFFEKGKLNSFLYLYFVVIIIGTYLFHI